MASSRSSARSRSASAPRRPPRVTYDSVVNATLGTTPGVLYGSAEPRICTPPLRELTPETSLGFRAIEFATDVLQITLFPWQRALLIRALEVIGDLDGEWYFRFRNCVVLVARQNGKSTLAQVLALFFMYVLGIGLVLGTAQDLDTAEEVWEGALDMIEGNAELAALADKPIKVNGKKTIRLLTGERYKVKAASRRAGRGLSGDLILLDELREHQNFDSWGAITKTAMARPNAQIWSLSNAGDAASVVLRYLRKMAHAALGDPDGINAQDDPTKLLDVDLDESAAIEPDETLGIFEWSAPPGCPVDDREGWQQANPSLGYSITERTVRSACKTDPEWVFRTEVLCQWSDGTLVGPFPTGAWDKGIDDTASIAADSKVGYCLDVSWDRSMAYIAAAGLTAEGKVYIEIIARRPGTDWVKGWFTEKGNEHRLRYRVAIQSSGPAGALVDELRSVGVKVEEWSGGDLGRACGRIYDLVAQVDAEGKSNLVHRPAPVLDVPAATAVTRPLLGDSWVWDRKKSPVDCAPLMAATGAVWLVSPKPEDPAPAVYAWPDEDEIKAWEEAAL